MLDLVSIVIGFVAQNLVGIAVGAIFGWVIPQPSWANKFVSVVAPYINKGFAIGKALVEKFKTKK